MHTISILGSYLGRIINKPLSFWCVLFLFKLIKPPQLDGRVFIEYHRSWGHVSYKTLIRSKIL